MKGAVMLQVLVPTVDELYQMCNFMQVSGAEHRPAVLVAKNKQRAAASVFFALMEVRNRLLVDDDDEFCRAVAYEEMFDLQYRTARWEVDRAEKGEIPKIEEEFTQKFGIQFLWVCDLLNWYSEELESLCFAYGGMLLGELEANRYAVHQDWCSMYEKVKGRLRTLYFRLAEEHPGTNIGVWYTPEVD